MSRYRSVNAIIMQISHNYHIFQSTKYEYLPKNPLYELITIVMNSSCTVAKRINLNLLS